MIQIRHISQYHSDMIAKGANMYFMMFRKDDWSEIKRGYVVSGHSGDDSHRLCNTKKEAREFINNL